MRYFLISVLVVLTFTSTTLAQRKKKTVQKPSFDASVYEGLKWRNIGPYRGGRSVAVSGVVNDPLTYYMGSTGGGLWKTEDAGISWANVSDKYFKTGSVGAIGISESDPNVIYVGMGEHPVRGVMTSHGDGIYKSTDAGKSWKHAGLPESRHISDVIVHPENPEIVVVSVQGAQHNASSNRGIYRTKDGGQNWEKVLYINENTGASGLSMDMNNPRILYAAMWEHHRYPWKMQSGGVGSGIHKSTDGGASWTKLSEGLPEAMGKIGVSVSRANSQRVFAIIEAEGDKAGVYRSDDGGTKWMQVNKDRVNIARAWYYMEIFADPGDQETVYVLNAPIMRSIDGGRTFVNVPVGHGDTHDLWIDPANSQRIINANDGGATVSFNAGKSWSTLQNQSTAQFYRVNTDNQFPYYVYGGQQDNSSMAIASRTNFVGVGWKDWFAAAGGESAYLAFDPDNPSKIYGSSIEGFITEYNKETKDNKSIDVYPELLLGGIPKDMKYRFNWNPPLVSSPHNPSVMYYGANVLLKTQDRGITWTEISADLTRNNLDRQGEGGGPYTNEAAGGENYNTIMYVQESSLEKDVIWVGSDDGLVHVTRNGGDSWSNVSPPNLKEGIINAIDASPHSKGTAYITVMRYKFGDVGPYIFKTTDYGTTWSAITNGIPQDEYVRVVREDSKISGLLFAGTERGFYMSNDAGANWNKLQLNLPPAPITDMTTQDNDLVISTAGRGFWILDDIGSIQQSNGKLDGSKSRLFTPKPTVRFESGNFAGIQFPNTGMNPINGMLIDYYLPDQMDSANVILEVLKGSEVVRSYTNKKSEVKPYPGGPGAVQALPVKKGLNRFAWDLRKSGIPGIDKTFVFGDYRGHLMAPGSYDIRFIVDSDTSVVTASLIPDPRLKINNQVYQEAAQVLDDIDAVVTDIHESINKLRKVKKQILSFNELLKQNEEADTLIQYGNSVVEKMKNWEEELVQVKHETFQDVVNFESQLSAQFMFLKSYIDAADPTMTQGARERLKDLKSSWSDSKSVMESLISDDFKSYNDLYREKNIPALIFDE